MWLEARGFSLTRIYREDFHGIPEADLLIVLGSPNSVANGHCLPPASAEIDAVWKSEPIWPAGMRPTQDYWVRYAMTDMIFAGVFERNPKLQVGSVEHEISWAPHWLRNMDYTYEERPQYIPFKSKERMLPSDYWRRNMFGVFTEDDIGVRCRDVIGIDNMMWGNDYPHSESTWPRSMELLDRHTKGILGEDERNLIVHDNLVELYKLKLAA